MAKAFRRQQERYVAVLDAQERALVASLMRQVLILLDPPAPAEAVDPFEDLMARAGLGDLDGLGGSDPADDLDRDPALDRLLPDAHRTDPLVSAEFRRMAGPGLRDRKAANLVTAVAALERADGDRDRLRLDEDEARAFAVALTDVRLVLGERLGFREDEDPDALDRALDAGQLDEGTAWLAAVYDFLTWLQESLTVAMLRG